MFGDNVKLEFVEQQSLFHKNPEYKKVFWKKYKTEILVKIAFFWLLGIFLAAANFGILLLIKSGQGLFFKIVFYISFFFLDFALIRYAITIYDSPLQLYSMPKLHIYSPYTVEPSDLMKHELYYIAKNNSKAVFVDPLYVGRLNPEGAILRSAEGLKLNWIPYQEKNVVKRGLYFAVVPLTTVVTKHNNLVIRVFLRNLTNKLKRIKLYYVPTIEKLWAKFPNEEYIIITSKKNFYIYGLKEREYKDTVAYKRKDGFISKDSIQIIGSFFFNKTNKYSNNQNNNINIYHFFLL